MLEILSLIIQFFKNNIETIITLCSLLFVAIQTRTLSRTYKYNCSWQEKEKAAELAYMYKENILPNVNYISAVQKDTGIMELLGNINLDSIATFNQTELFRLTNTDIEKHITEKQYKNENITLLITYRQIFKQICNKKMHDINPLLIEKWIAAEGKEKDKDGKEIKIQDEEKAALLDALWREFFDIVSNALNDLEFFSMNFISGVADDSIVFPSLHQTYLTLVQLLYYYIAIQNKNEKDKFYTNVIELFEKWRTIDKENEKKISNAISRPLPIKK